MRIVQISDLHIGNKGEDTFGIDVRGNFLKIQAAITKCRPDHLILSGDLCYRKGKKEIYYWIKKRLEAIGFSYDIISGNHDDPVMIAQIFNLENQLKNKELYYSKCLDDQPVLFLDTSPGTMSIKQIQWLKDQLFSWKQDMIIFMHHPPFYFGVPYMDNKYAFQNRKEIQDIFFSFPYNITVFSGHYHVEKSLRVKNVLAYITPSCFFQIDQYSETFNVDHLRIGFREIIAKDGVVISAVNYLDDTS